MSAYAATKGAILTYTRAVAKEVGLDVENVEVLELQVHCPGSSDRARAAWLDPYVLSK